jgi:L-ascorbate metabolism protein UlaG (beta-lactamase superfamily)
MIKPVLQDEAFLADVAEARAEFEHFHLWWLGQSGFLLQWAGRHLLFDPYLSDSLTKKYAGTANPHVRMTERVIGPEQLNFIDAVTSSHNHTDHLDAETLIPLLQANPKMELVVPEANREFVVDRLRIVAELPRGLDAGKFATVGPFKIHAVPAAHEQFEQDENGRHKFLGYVVEFGGWFVYHSGDTVGNESLVEWVRRWPIDVALLPINGRGTERRVAGNLWGREAAQLARNIGARLVIPCHYEMFEFNTATPEEFVAACGRLGQPHRVLRAGERWSSREFSQRATPISGRT